MARSGRLLELSHRAQPAGSAPEQTRRQAEQRTAPVRHGTAAAAASRLEARLVELGFGGDLAGYLRRRVRTPGLGVERLVW
jgi:hypothetical protein